ncbi:MAG: glycosyltransferase family 39 protein [Streptosporangiaceae bacterium]
MSETAERGLAEPGSAEPGQAVPKERKGLARWADWLVIAVPAVTAFVVGGYEIGGPSLWRDEAYTRDAITRPVGKIFALLARTDAVHGAYYLLMHFVVDLIGTSATALRFPSLCAMVVATGFTAAIGRRAAMLVQAPDGAAGGRTLVPALTGLLSGLVFATAPFMTYYAQMARSYAIVTMVATIASYLLLRAYPGGGWRWWSAYGAAVALTGLFNVFGLLILAAHGVTLLLTATTGAVRPGRQPGRRIGRFPVGWLAASAAAVVVLVPLLRITYGQRGQISWLTRPDFETIASLCRDFAGSSELIAPVGLLALGGVTACCLADDWRPLNPAAIALPWLVVPPFLLIAVSFVDPVYDQRYVEFCLPALAILVASGMVGLVRLAFSPRLRRAWRAWRAWLPPAAAAVVALGIAVLLVGPQATIRQTSQRPDNLRLASAIVAANERPGDVVFYLPLNARVLGTGYPAPFRKLRDLAAARSAVASNTLAGTEINSPALLASRFTNVQRVWVVSGQSNGKFPVPYTAIDKEKLALLANAGLHVLHQWRAGEVLLTLYGH